VILAKSASKHIRFFSIKQNSVHLQQVNKLEFFKDQDSAEIFSDLVSTDAAQIVRDLPGQRANKRVVPAVQIGFILHIANLDRVVLNDCRADGVLKQAELHRRVKLLHLGNHMHLQVPALPLVL
jgi:cobalamin biosynthesis protein CobT